LLVRVAQAQQPLHLTAALQEVHRVSH